jgi:hypothetical protein
MRKYSKTWKERENRLRGGWAQDGYGPNGYKCWFWHYINYGTEYAERTWYSTKEECEIENRTRRAE